MFLGFYLYRWDPMHQLIEVESYLNYGLNCIKGILPLVHV